jgi:hypothetical protein
MFSTIFVFFPHILKFITIKNEKVTCNHAVYDKIIDSDDLTKGYSYVDI